MRFTTQRTTTINPMIPRTNQIIRLISTSSSCIRCAQCWAPSRLVFPASRVCPTNLLGGAAVGEIGCPHHPQGGVRDPRSWVYSRPGSSMLAVSR